MIDINVIIGIISALLSAASLLAMVFGIKLGRKALFKGETLYGEEAEKRYASIKAKMPEGSLFIDGKYEGGNKLTPQLEIERFNYNKQIIGDEWKRINKTVRYYYKGPDGKTMVKGWRLK